MMTTRVIPLVPAGILLVSSALVPFVHPAQAASGSSKSDFARIDAYVQKQMDDARIPGIALGIVHGDRIVHLEGFGRADESGGAVTPQTPFIIGSVTKSFTALAIMQLAEAGRIGLDTPVQRYIPWFRVSDPVASARITVRQLLNQTSGLSDATGTRPFEEPETQTIEQTIRDLRTAQLDRPVGSSFEYSNANYIVLGLLIQVVSHEPYGAYIQRHIFQPLAMRHSYTSQDRARQADLATGYRYWFGVPVAFDAPYYRAVLPAGYLISTAEDMSHYLAMYLSGGRYHGSVLLSPAGLSQMERPPRGSTYGMGWFVGSYGGVPALSHAGAVLNFQSEIVLVPHGHWGIIVLENIAGPLASLTLEAIPQSVTGMVAEGQGEVPTNLGTAYLLFDLLIVIIVAVQIWSLVRLLRRRDQLELALRGSRRVLRQGRRWVLPLLWEIAAPTVLLLGNPLLGDTPATRAAPDLSYSALAILGLWLLTGLTRLVKGGMGLRRRRGTRPITGTLPPTLRKPA